MPNPRPNPYPGPRSFQRGEKLYGRERETAELLDLLIAERIVLLSSPSGAGKTSLVQAALIPVLEAEGFRVLPVMRPGLPDPRRGDPSVVAPPAGEGGHGPPGVLREGAAPTAVAPANRYILSLLLSLERELSEAEQTPLAELAGTSLAGYLDRRPAPQEGGRRGDVLIFDQFEEVLTVDPTDRDAKLAFFDQVGQALRDRNRWALFSMREEFVASLDPYLRPIPARFDKGRRYRLDLLGPDAAREAMQGPAADQDPPVAFTDAAARKLADDLRRVQVQQPDGTTATTLGQYIEPVQLQVVCRRLWDGLAPDDMTIDMDDLAAVGDVDTALRGYYADTVAAVAKETDVGEQAIRKWVDRQLITEGGIRGQVLMGREASQGLANAAIWQLVDAHLVRSEQRRGATWFELAHDRLIGPVRQSNQMWLAGLTNPVIQGALAWENAGKPFAHELSAVGALTEESAKGCAGEWVLVFHPKLAMSLLQPLAEANWLREDDLQAAEITLMQRPDEYSKLEREYVLASRGAAYYRRRVWKGLRVMVFPVLLLIFGCGILARLPTLPSLNEKQKEIDVLSLLLSEEELTNGETLAREGRIDLAEQKYAQALARRAELVKKASLKSDTHLMEARRWVALCRYSALWGHPVVKRCDQAVAAALEPFVMGTFVGYDRSQEMRAYDSRGLARSLTGDLKGAIEDFRKFVQWTKLDGTYEADGKQREAWIAALEAGGNPFDEETLKALRNK